MKKYIILTLLTFSFLLGEEANHIIFTRITITPDQAEMIAIYNPTNGVVNLSNYYLSDAEFSTMGKHYYNLPTGVNYWSGYSSDFMVRFPDIDIDSEQTLTLSLHDVSSFNSYYSYDPDLTIDDMLDAVEGQNTIGSSSDLLGDSYEVLILFKWDGNPASLIQDIDYFYWGFTEGLALSGIDKSGVLGYEPDTPFNIQANNILEAHVSEYTYTRQSTNENGESGPSNNVIGNGITLHDETSEVFIDSWKISNDFGCTLYDDANYDPDAIFDDESCESYLGCADPDDPFYNPDAIIDDGSCYYVLVTHTFEEIISGDPEVDIDFEATVLGLVVGYGDYTNSNGPQVIILEDTQGDRLDMTVWDFDVPSSSIGYMVDPSNPSEYIVTVAGLVGNYQGTWQLEVSSPDNITLYEEYNFEGEFIEDDTIQNVSVNPLPFVLVPSIGEKLNYTYSVPSNSRVTIRIFDFNGNLVTSLKDTYFINGGIQSSSWDGIDHVGQVVPPGTYFIHIEATDWSNADTSYDMAPIVVGVRK